MLALVFDFRMTAEFAGILLACKSNNNHNSYFRVVTISFSQAYVWLLFDGGNYSRTASICRNVVLKNCVTLYNNLPSY